MQPGGWSRRQTLVVFLALELGIVFALALGFQGGIPWVATGAAAVVILECASIVRRGLASRIAILIPWIALVVWICAVIIVRRSVHVVNYAHTGVGFIAAGALAAAAWRIMDDSCRQQLRRAALAWSILGASCWLWIGYQGNLSWSFHLALVFWVCLLIAVKRIFELRPIVIQLLNTALLLAIFLPLVDWAIRPKYVLDTEPDTRGRYYSYEVARRDSVTFSRWWKFFVQQWNHLGDTILIRDPTETFPFRLAPSREARFFQSSVVINSRGFRGKEIAEVKGDIYRIVAIGESTTFGFTMNSTDRTWPEWLEEMIAERISPARSFEVINAGIPSYTLQNNMDRLATDILPLSPDMIISYHGINGFVWLDPSLPPLRDRRPPAFRERPLRLLADAEYRIRILHYNARRAAASSAQSAPPMDPLNTVYGAQYERLIESARTNEISLVLANYSMAANSRSPSGVIQFYRGGFPRVYDQIRANELHSVLLRKLGQGHPQVYLVDTHEALDGHHEHFIDLIHFTESGRERLAENMFNGIRALLERELRPADGP
jgi:lysophospholipase L1-like esterase